MGFLSSGMFYGSVAVFVKLYLPAIAASWFQNAMIFAFLSLAMISATMGKGIDDDSKKVLYWLYGISIFFVLVNLAIVVVAILVLFLGNGMFLTVLVTGIFLGTYILPPLFFDPEKILCSPLTTFYGITSYMFCMPIYQIIF
jgi:hypothetical protein